MNINTSTTSPNFNANIKFVRSREFNKCMFRQYFYCSKPENPLNYSMGKGEKLWTWEIRTCTGGGVVGDDGAVGFHIYDAKENLDKIGKEFLSELKQMVKNPVSALIIGAKDIPRFPNSVPVFETISNEVKKLVKPSEFKVYAHRFGESDIGYEKATDTWFINTIHPENPMIPNTRKIEIEDVEDLKSMFKSIKIAPQDRLFIHEKEVLPKDYPELFMEK